MLLGLVGPAEVSAAAAEADAVEAEAMSEVAPVLGAGVGVGAGVGLSPALGSSELGGAAVPATDGVDDAADNAGVDAAAAADAAVDDGAAVVDGLRRAATKERTSRRTWNGNAIAFTYVFVTNWVWNCQNCFLYYCE